MLGFYHFYFEIDSGQIIAWFIVLAFLVNLIASICDREKKPPTH